MSVTNQQSSVQYTLTSATQTVAYPFRILSDTDIKITRTRTGISDLILTISSDYTVSGVGVDAGGSVIFTGTDTAIADVVLIERFTEVTQEATYVTNGKFPAAVQEYGLDKLTLIALDTDRRIGVVEAGLAEIQEDITSIDASVAAAAASAASSASSASNSAASAALALVYAALVASASVALIGLSGNVAGKLDYLITAGSSGLPIDSIRDVLTGTAGTDLATSRWALVAGTFATDGVSYQRPADYNGTTNQKVWVRVG